jgi:hypothetical protein
MKIILILIKILSCVAYANAHGHLIEPPNRLFDPIEPNNEIDWKTGNARVLVYLKMTMKIKLFCLIFSNQYIFTRWCW